jgi:hypothetical protein
MRWRSRRRDSVCVDIEVSFARDMAAVHKLLLSGVVRLGSARFPGPRFLNYHDPSLLSRIHRAQHASRFKFSKVYGDSTAEAIRSPRFISNFKSLESVFDCLALSLWQESQDAKFEDVVSQ